MPLESATYISDLNTSNPVGSTDKVQTLDDHVRLIKSTLKTTFPSVTGAVTAAHSELNILDGVTATAAELNILDGVTLTAANINNAALKNASNAFTAKQTIDVAAANVADFDGAGGAYVNFLDAGVAKFAIGDGGALGGTAGAAAIYVAGAIRVQITDSTTTIHGIAHTDFARLSQSNTFTGASQIIAVGVGQQAEVRVSGNNGGAGGAGLGLVDDGIAGYLYQRSNRALVFGTNNLQRFDITAAGNFDFKAGAVTTDNASANEVGYKGTPQNAQAGDYTLVLTDAGKTIYKASGGAGETITIPANGTIAFPVGSIVRVVNNGGGALSIAITTDTLSLAGAGTTGTRTLADHGVAVLEKVASTEWFISGAGVS